MFIVLPLYFSLIYVLNHRFAILLLLSQSPTGWLKSCKSWGAPRGWWFVVMFLGWYPMNTIFLQFYHVLSYYFIVISTINHRIQSLQVTGTSPVNLSSRCHAQFAAMVGVIVTSAFGTLYLERQLKASSKDRGTRRCGEGVVSLKRMQNLAGNLRFSGELHYLSLFFIFWSCYNLEKGWWNEPKTQR